MLTKSLLESLEPETYFATGTTHDLRLFKEPVRWVAIRGNITDWAIYYHRAYKTVLEVMVEGDKVRSREVVKDLVPCDDETLNLYRL